MEEGDGNEGGKLVLTIFHIVIFIILLLTPSIRARRGRSHDSPYLAAFYMMSAEPSSSFPIQYLLEWPIFLLLLTGFVFNCSNRNSTRKYVRSKSKKSGREVKTEPTESKTTETSVVSSTAAKAIHQKESTGVANLFAQETTIAASLGRKSEKDQRSRKSVKATKQKSASERATRDKTPSSQKSKRFSQRSERTRSKEKLRTVSDPPSQKNKKSEELVSNRTNTKSVSERNSQRNSQRKCTNKIRSPLSMKSAKKARSSSNLGV